MNTNTTNAWRDAQAAAEKAFDKEDTLGVATIEVPDAAWNRATEAVANTEGIDLRAWVSPSVRLDRNLASGRFQDVVEYRTPVCIRGRRLIVRGHYWDGHDEPAGQCSFNPDIRPVPLTHVDGFWL